MGFLSDISAGSPARQLSLNGNGGDPVHVEKFYKDLIERRPALLDEKLKLHARIIDEFNLTLLEKLPREELVRQVSHLCRPNMCKPRKSRLTKKNLKFSRQKSSMR